MKRLIRKAAEENLNEKEKEVDLEASKIALDEIENGIEGLNKAYEKLFHGLSALYEEYPKLYDSMKKVVKFPDEKEAQDVAEMRIDFDDIRDHYDDPEYLSTTLELYDKN